MSSDLTTVDRDQCRMRSSQLRPDAMPILGTQIDSADNAVRCLFDRDAAFDRDFLEAGSPLGNHDGMNVDGSSEIRCSPAFGLGEITGKVHRQDISPWLSQLEALGQYSSDSRRLLMPSMATIDEIRHARLLELLAERGDNVQQLASELGKSHSQISQLKNRSKHSTTGKPRGIGDDLAREIEERLRKPHGWMDAADISDGYIVDVARRSDDVRIEQWDAAGAMGASLVLKEQPGVIHGWTVSRDWLHHNVKQQVSAVNNLAIVTGFGDSMRPMFNPGDPLLIDIGVKTVEFEGVYFFRVDNEGFIKRLQRVPGVGLRVLSENSRYEAWTVKSDMDFEVFGRVLKVWRSDDF